MRNFGRASCLRCRSSPDPWIEMKRYFDFAELWANVKQLVFWTILVLPVAIISGSASAFFLWALERVTQLRWQHGWLIYLLPVGGILISLIYRSVGKKTEGGSNLILDEIHQPGGGVPARMAPIILLTTLAT